MGRAGPLGSAIAVIFVEHWEVDRLDRFSGNLGGSGLGFVAGDGVGSEVVAAQDGRHAVGLPLATGCGASLASGFALPRHLLPLLEATQAGSVDHLLADGRPGHDDLLLLDLLGEIGHLGIAAGVELLPNQILERLRLVVLPASLDVVGVDLAILVAARVGGSVDQFLWGTNI